MSGKVSLIVLAYRQETYVGPAVASALAQRHPGLEIILSDDGSPDATFEIMQEHARAYHGPHEVRLNRNAKNRGLVDHFNHAVAMASGDVVIYLAGDDIASPDRAAILAGVLAADPALTFAESLYVPFSGAADPRAALDDAGPRPVTLRRFDRADFMSREAPRLSSSTRAFRRELLLKYPPLEPRLASEDTSSALRLLHFGPGAIVQKKLLAKREHERNLTGPEALKKLNFDLIREQYLRDARHARELGRLSAAELQALEDWAFSHMERRKLRVLFDLGYPSAAQLAGTILPSRHLRPREKVFAVRRFLRGLLAPRR